MPKTILIVDDDPKIPEAVRLVLESAFEITSAASASEATGILKKRNVSLILLDIALNGTTNGIDFLRLLTKSGNQVPVIMITASDTAEMAVQAMKMGAVDYFTKPFHPEEIRMVVEETLRGQKAKRELDYLRSHVKELTFDHMIGRAASMQPVYDTIKKMCGHEATVLITGESGTGKELAARAIHYHGTRKGHPFIAINCAAIPENLLEAELFGYEKGAFTGADGAKPGKFELADGGTMFLDEISSLKKEMQGKILRVLQEMEFERVGGVKVIRADVRIIAATNVALRETIRNGEFREDLYYRLNVIPIHLPPLRERKEDIPLLCEHFLEKFNHKFHKRVREISEESLGCFRDYGWPGNIRELENVIERLVVLSEKESIEIMDLPFEIFFETRVGAILPSQEEFLLKKAREQFEKLFIQTVLEKFQGNQVKASQALGIHRNTLTAKKAQLNIEKEQSRR